MLAMAVQFLKQTDLPASNFSRELVGADFGGIPACGVAPVDVWLFGVYSARTVQGEGILKRHIVAASAAIFATLLVVGGALAITNDQHDLLGDVARRSCIQQVAERPARHRRRRPRQGSPRHYAGAVAGG